MTRAARPKSDRRAVISRALYDCISRQGYAATTLTDIADQAKMSPSHISYYFDSKAAILEHYSTGLCEQILNGLPDLAEPDAERLTDSIAEYCFGAGQLNTDFLGVIQEITGVAVHDPRLRKIKSAQSTAWRKYLEVFFEQIHPTGGLTPGEAARTVHAMLVGLDTNTLFDRGLSRKAAHGIFRRTLRTLSGLDVEHKPRPAGSRRRASPR